MSSRFASTDGSPAAEENSSYASPSNPSRWGRRRTSPWCGATQGLPPATPTYRAYLSEVDIPFPRNPHCRLHRPHWNYWLVDVACLLLVIAVSGTWEGKTN